MSKLCSVALSVGLHCEIVVFPDHTACTGPEKYLQGGGGVQAHPPQVFLVLNLIYRSSMGSFQRNL